MGKQARECSIANALELIGERWSLLALREVFLGVHRFDQIARNTGASRETVRQWDQEIQQNCGGKLPSRTDRRPGKDADK